MFVPRDVSRFLLARRFLKEGCFRIFVQRIFYVSFEDVLCQG